LAYEYLDRVDLVHVVDPEKKEWSGEATSQELSQIRVTPPQSSAENRVKESKPEPVMSRQSSEVKKLMGTSADAQACRNCGDITLRNGTCYMCPNCGTTTGCS